MFSSGCAARIAANGPVARTKSPSAPSLMTRIRPFCGDAAERFRVGRGRDNHVRQHVGGGHVPARAGQMDDSFGADPGDLGFQFVPVCCTALVVADQQDADIGAGKAAGRFDQDALAFPARQPPRQHDDGRIVGQPPCLGKLDHPFGGNRVRIETVHVDSAGDDADFFAGRAVVFFDMASDKFGDRDHALSLRHDRVIGLLGGIAEIICPVKGRHEGHAAPLGRAAGAPCRRPTAGVNDRNIMGPDGVGDRLHVPAHDQRILAVDRQGHVQTAGAFDLVRHGTAGRCDDGAPARRRQGRGDIDRSAFDAAGRQRRQHLQHSRCFRIGGRRAMTCLNFRFGGRHDGYVYPWTTATTGRQKF